jgi:hypothetical protein
MHLELELTSEEGSLLRRQASLHGREMQQYAKELITKNLQPASVQPRESVLLQTINKTFSNEFWKRFRALDRKRRKASITEAELQELIAKTEELEAANVERVSALIDLSQYWQLDLDALIQKLGPLNGKNF